MSQDLRREREDAKGIRAGNGIHLYDGDTPIGMMLTDEWAGRVVVAFKNAKYWRDLSTGQTERNAELLEKLRAANAKIAEANEALEQARRDAATAEPDGTVAKIREWLDRREAAVAERASEAISPATGGFNDLGAIESRAAKLRRAQSDGKLLHELRQLLEVPRPSQVRYWTCSCSVFYRLRDGHELETVYPITGMQWRPSVYLTFDSMNAGSCNVREITAAELPEGVTP